MRLVHRIKWALATMLARFRAGEKAIQNLRLKRHGKRLRRLGGVEERFTHIYHSNFWGHPESVSGEGSSEEYTRGIRESIPPLLAEYGVNVLLDAPCGDYNWFRLMQLPPHVKYIGGDIVLPLVEQNQAEFGDDRTNFMHLDITRTALPKADLWLCRDCLFHLSFDSIWRVLQQFASSEIEYLLTSTHSKHSSNIDIASGDFRLLNLECPPFNFPPALHYLPDWVEGSPERYLGLWSRAQVAALLNQDSTLAEV